MPRPLVIFFAAMAGIVIVLGAILLYGVFVVSPLQEEQHAARCATRGLSAARHTEATGKTTVTARFCVDREDRVYWLPE